MPPQIPADFMLVVVELRLQILACASVRQVIAHIAGQRVVGLYRVSQGFRRGAVHGAEIHGGLSFGHAFSPRSAAVRTRTFMRSASSASRASRRWRSVSDSRLRRLTAS